MYSTGRADCSLVFVLAASSMQISSHLDWLNILLLADCTTEVRAFQDSRLSQGSAFVCQASMLVSAFAACIYLVWK